MSCCESEHLLALTGILGGDRRSKAATGLNYTILVAQAAWSIRAQANCAMDDQEAARSDFRRVSRPVMIRSTKKFCRDHGIDL
jgi:hypothetical protein